MSNRSEQVAVVLVVGVVVGLMAWWKSVGLVTTLIAMAIAVGCFVLFDWGLGRHATGLMPTPSRETRIQEAVPTASEDASASTDRQVEEVELLSSDAPVGSPIPLHQPSAGDQAPDEFGSAGDGRLFWVRVPKQGNSMAECEDAIAWSSDGSTVVVSDGAGSSFGAAAWAAVLADRFVADPPTALSNTLFASWLESCRLALARQTDPAAVSNDWWTLEGSRRGAFATIAGARLREVEGRKELLTMCVGDSCVMVVRGDAGTRKVMRSVPFDDAKQFGSHPMLVGSPEGAVTPEPSWTTLRIEPGDLVLVASDALSEWLLGDPSRVSAIDLPPAELVERLRSQRAAGQIVSDDLSVVGLTIT